MTVDTREHGRVNSLDYLRGLAACGIMAYHMQLLNFGEVDASSVLAKIKIYGVAIFYILSGLTLYIVYSKSFNFDKEDFIDFYLKRFFRIFPLLWLVTLLTFLMGFDHAYPSLQNIILNITVFPGVIRPYGFAANGAWSIGNEIFFYMVFPFLIWTAKVRLRWFWLCQGLISGLFLVFTFMVMNTGHTLTFQWANYVNPLNQIFYFSTGIFLGTLNVARLRSKLVSVLILPFLYAIYAFPVSGNAITLVYGWHRIFFTFCIVVICLLFYISDFSFFPGFLKKTLKLLGETSYSIYLMHPIVFTLLKKISARFMPLPVYMLIILTIGFTLLISFFTYTYFEKYFVGLGKKYINKRKAALLNSETGAQV